MYLSRERVLALVYLPPLNRLCLPQGLRPQCTRKIVGYCAEQQVLWALQKTGMRFLERNWRCPHGEIDLILDDHGELVFVEVKSRLTRSVSGAPRTVRPGSLFDNITLLKQKRLRLLVELYLASYYRKQRPSVRIDVVGVLLDGQSLRLLQIEHIRAAI